MLENLPETSVGILCVALVTTPEKRCDDAGQGAEGVHQDISWDAASQL